jgi:hypothetical protein
LRSVEDKIISFLICHKLPEVDRVYWFKRVEELREIYTQRQQYLTPIKGCKKWNDHKTIKKFLREGGYLDAQSTKYLKLYKI